MAQHPYTESDLVAFDDVVAGHDGVLSDTAGEVIVKPCTPAEIGFYESANAYHPAFAAHMPTYMGQLELSAQNSTTLDETTAAAAASSLPSAMHHTVPTTHTVEPPPGPSTSGRGRKLETNVCIVLANAAAGFVRPNVLDVKLGARLWDASADEAKRTRLDGVAAATTNGSLGFRIAGMRVWQGSDVQETKDSKEDGGEREDGGYKVYGKPYGRAFNAENVQAGFEEFLFIQSAGLTRELGKVVARRFEAKLRQIEAVLETEESRMVGSSLLFVFEGDGHALRLALDEEEDRQQRERTDEVTVKEKLKERKDVKKDPEDDGGEDEGDEGEDGSFDEAEDSKPRIHAVKLIDFAHASWAPGQGPDENVLKGVRSVAKILDDIQQTP